MSHVSRDRRKPAIIYQISNKKLHVKTRSISLPLRFTAVFVIFRLVDIFFYKIAYSAWTKKDRIFWFSPFERSHNFHNEWSSFLTKNACEGSYNIATKQTFSYQKNVLNISSDHNLLIWCIIIIILSVKKQKNFISFKTI